MNGPPLKDGVERFKTRLILDQPSSQIINRIYYWMKDVLNLWVYQLFIFIYSQKGTCHEGKKPQMCVFLDDDRLFTTGFSRMSERQLALWDSDNLNECIWRQELDITNGVLFPFYDPDTQLIFICGKVRSISSSLCTLLHEQMLLTNFYWGWGHSIIKFLLQRVWVIVVFHWQA